jgi:endonuclease/exonuclease/phosphatase family metal-dependent hydrolase
MALRVLTWNLFHGRAVPPAGRDLFEEFAAALDRWRWDAALLQEVPPWWSGKLAARLGAGHRWVLTSRNTLLPLRRAIAVRWPDLIKSNGGGSNAILVRAGNAALTRDGHAIVEHRVRRLSLLPERRWVHAVRLGNGLWLANLHTAANPRQGQEAAKSVLDWAQGERVVLGGDFNVAQPALEGFVHAGGIGVDHVFARGLTTPESAEVLDHGSLSDHAPVAVAMSAPPGSA